MKKRELRGLIDPVGLSRARKKFYLKLIQFLMNIEIILGKILILNKE